MAVSLGSVNKGLIVIIWEGGTLPGTALHPTFRPSLLPSDPPPINTLKLVLVAQTGRQKGSEVPKRGFSWVAANILHTNTAPHRYCPTPLRNNAPLFCCPTPTKTSGLLMSVSSVSRNTRPTFDRL